MRLNPSFCVLAAILLSLTACTGTKTSDRDIDLLSVDDARTAVEIRSGVLGIGEQSRGAFVDCRSAAAYEKLHIAGAVSMPFADVTRRHELLEPYHTLIVYGDDYNDPLAQAMTKRLIELGHDRVHLLRGGLRAWEASGGATE